MWRTYSFFSNISGSSFLYSMNASSSGSSRYQQIICLMYALGLLWLIFAYFSTFSAVSFGSVRWNCLLFGIFGFLFFFFRFCCSYDGHARNHPH